MQWLAGFVFVVLFWKCYRLQSQVDDLCELMRGHELDRDATTEELLQEDNRWRADVEEKLGAR